MTTTEKKYKLTQKDINRTMFRWYFTTEMSLNYEKMQSIAFTYALLPVISKLYGKEEDRKEAIQRHLELFNTNTTSGGLILGTVLAMEEEKSSNDSISGNAIVGIKTGLMGPVAAFGDSFSAGTLQTLCILAASTMAAAGSYLGLLMLFLGNFILMSELVITTNLTYKKGREAIKDVLSSKVMTDVLEGANILGMMMMGALTAAMVSLKTVLSVTFGETKMAIQDNIDKLIPGLFSILVLFLFYYLIRKKNVGIAKIIFGTIIVSIVLSFFGIV
ncbi:MAG TPA: PTS system mannose/fructose/sorbose family transporter subunit IID [Tetragenococcus sp.]|nr:PTS system mannose/fructose/sorbose family transporter subunit IID [Tetragenococcus sp.]